MPRLHPIFNVLISRPELVMDHVAGYAALVQDEASQVGRAVVGRIVAWVVAALTFILFVVLAGVALMLGAVNEFHWMLVVVPGAALALAIGAFIKAKKPLPSDTFGELKAQMEADAQALRAAGAGA